MAHKQVLFRSEARERILRGVAALADAVRVTLGPKSKCVLLEKRFGAPVVCNDGVTIAKEMELKDPVENLGAQMIRQAAERTGDAVGDGTSTSTILAHAIFADGVRNVVAGASAVDLKQGLDRGARAAVEALKRLSRPVTSRLEKAQVATISAHNDQRIGDLVADAMEKVGNEGVITVEESKTTETQLEVVEGLQFDRGYLSPYFVTDAEKMEAVLEDTVVLLTDRKIGVMKDLVPILEQAAQRGTLDPGRRRGRRRGGARHARGQQDPRLAQMRRGEGPRVRRPAQGDARGHGGPDRQPRPHRGDRHQARSAHHRGSRPRRSGRGGQGHHHHHRRRGRQGADRRPQASRSGHRSTRPRATTTARSSRSGWPGSRAAWPSSGSGRRRKRR